MHRRNPETDLPKPRVWSAHLSSREGVGQQVARVDRGQARRDDQLDQLAFSLAGAPARDEFGEAVALTGVPYYTWGNRQPGAMRIWVPTA